MKNYSTILLIKILRSTVDHVQESPDFDQASPGVKELKRVLLEQIVKLQGNHADSPLTVQEGHTGCVWNSLTES